MHITLVAALAVSTVVCLLIALASEEAANRLEESGETHVKSETAFYVLSTSLLTQQRSSSSPCY